ncbi:PqqD family protein [Williamwhitmania taraxaci]|uniref:Coenzyme PQQ synthesis protein D (PqqD) n=1 Tax=Williamwhitmania taraxaci TaxID=1640674 RepID=A0A1G6R497_9BACT|nr:PqqD family protein [Williamwhitmania taraxaci]SDC99331.1 Coenzyme PQQ synthesis protein D (PqqD) [Williamwhitmania taraxaci]
MEIKGNIALSENGFVFNPTTGDSFTLNNTGKVVLSLIKEGKSIEQIKEQMKGDYEVDEVTLERYLVDFVNDLKVNNLLEE